MHGTWTYSKKLAVFSQSACNVTQFREDLSPHVVCSVIVDVYFMVCLFFSRLEHTTLCPKERKRVT